MGIPIYPPPQHDELAQPFYDGLAAGELRITFDPETGQWVWYPPEVVPGKPGAQLEWRAVGPEGTAYSYTTVTRSLLPGDHKAEVPFTIVLFEPDDAPRVRVAGLYVESGDRPAACGMRLKLSPVKAGDHIVAGFAPID